MKRVIVDSSALIALIYEETGCDIVEKHLHNMVMSTVNITEVASYMAEKGGYMQEIEELLKDLSIEIIDYNEEQAFIAAHLRQKTKSHGLSLGDRACLALAITEKLPVLTADKAWGKINVGVKVHLIR